MPSSEIERCLRAARHRARQRAQTFARRAQPIQRTAALTDIQFALRERANRILNDGLEHSPQAIRWAEDMQKGVR